MRTIGFGLVEGRSIFMDERTDSYFSIDPVLEADVEAAVERGGFIGPNDHLRAALELADEPARIVRAPSTAPTASLVEELGSSRVRGGDVLKAAFLLLNMKSQLRSWAIDPLLAQVSTKGSDQAPDTMPVDRAWRFLAARRFVPIRPNCLLDSLSLVRWLGGAGVSILFGVKLNPFAAHCWVQSGALVLNDRTENVAAFTVVRVIGCPDPTP